MSNIASKVAQIRQAILGKDVRESIASGIETINTEVESTTARQALVDANESSRISAEGSRSTSEQSRVSAESGRVNAENGRVSAESGRVNAENNRVVYYNEFRVWEQYDAFAEYSPGNKVTYLGSTYVNLVSCQGVLPTDETKWLLISKKGNDGAGTVIENTYTVVTNGVSNIPFGMTIDPLNDTIIVYDDYGQKLTENVNYTINANNESIDLVGWTVDTEYVFTFNIMKNSDMSSYVQRNEVGVVEEMLSTNKIIVPAINEIILSAVDMVHQEDFSNEPIEVIDTTVNSTLKPVPSKPSFKGIIKKASKFYEHYLKSDKDVIVMGIGDSVLTANNYTTNRSDASYRPPLFHQSNMLSFLEEELRWKTQIYNRFDIPSIFTEVATSTVTSDYDSAWDWQVGYSPAVPNLEANFKPAITRILDGTNASVSYVYPANMRRCNFIYRTDYLCASSTTVTIAEGNGKVEVFNEATQTWVEANGYSFSAKEDDVLLDWSFTKWDGSTYSCKYRKSIYQKRLNMRSLTVLTAKTVTITNVGAGRLNYWGIEYSKREYMFTLLNQARGGHALARLKAFESWDVDGFKPDLIILENPIINENATSTTNLITNRPQDFMQRHSDYVDALIAKSYLPEVIAITMFVSTSLGLIDSATGNYNVGTITGYGTITVMDYIGYLNKMYTTKDIVHLNMFYEYLKLAQQKAITENTNNIYTSALAGSGISGTTFTFEGAHPNDYGNLIAKTLLLPLFDFTL